MGTMDSVDSKEYLRDILNLSVDLDPDDDIDDTSVPIQVEDKCSDSFMNVTAYCCMLGCCYLLLPAGYWGRLGVISSLCLSYFTS